MASNKNENIKSVIEEVQYGKIKINLDKIMSARNISTYVLSNKACIRFQTIQKLREDSSTRIDFEVLAKICYALGCKTEDIIEYVPNEKSKE